MPARKRLDLSDLDFRPIPGEDDYSVTPIVDRGKFRRPEAVGPYGMDAAQFVVNDLGALGVEDVSSFIRTGLNTILPPIWQQLQPVVEMYRRVDVMLQAQGMELKSAGGFKSALPSGFFKALAAAKAQASGVVEVPNGLPAEFFWRTVYTWLSKPVSVGWLGEDAVVEEATAQPINITQIATDAVLVAIPAVGVIAGVVKLLGDGIKARRQTKANAHIEKWLGWMDFPGLTEVIGAATAAFVQAGGQIQEAGVSPPSEYVSSEFGNQAMAKWVKLGQSWEATPDVYLIDSLHEKLKASIGPLRAIADAKAKAISDARAAAAAKAKVDVPDQMNAIGNVVGVAIESGAITESEAAEAVTALHKLVTNEPLTDSEQVVVGKIAPTIESKSGMVKYIAAAAAAAAMLLL